MKLISRPLLLVAAALLAGCASAPPGHDAHAHAEMGAMDMHSMCEQHKSMMGDKSPAEQQAMMQERMKAMSPEMRQRMQQMLEQCGQPPARQRMDR